MRRIPFSSLLALLLAASLLLSCGGGSTAGAPPGPVVASVEPASGGVAGGNDTIIKGERLANTGVGANDVLIGGNPATNIKVLDDNTITCKSPSGTAGPAEVTVIKEHGSDTLPDGFTYYPAPTITEIDPPFGSRDGGFAVTVRGSGFLNNAPGKTLCMIGLKSLVNVVIVDDGTLMGETPSSVVETVKDVVVLNNNGQNTLFQGYQYVGKTPQVDSVSPDFGKTDGGEFVTIEGENFTLAGGQLVVTFGGGQAASVTRIDDETLTCFTPPGPSGEYVDVTVTNSNGPGTAVDAFYYLPAPQPTGVSPAKGFMTGSTPVTITGIGFTGGTPAQTFVQFGGASALQVVIVDDNTITCVAPPHPMGKVDVVVGNQNGSTALTDGFEYVSPIYWDTGGSTISMGNESVYTLDFTGGKTLPLYGASYSSCDIGDNGHINFNWVFTQATPRFLSTVSPMLQAWQADLNTGSGSVRVNQTADRVVVTWDEVPQNVNSGSVKVQIHMMFNGIIGLVFNGLGSGLTEGPLVGVSPILTVWPAMVDLSSPLSGDSSTALIEQFANVASFDLDDGYLMFLPDGSDGFTSRWYSGVPTAP